MEEFEGWTQDRSIPVHPSHPGPSCISAGRCSCDLQLGTGTPGLHFTILIDFFAVSESSVLILSHIACGCAKLDTIQHFSGNIRRLPDFQGNLGIFEDAHKGFCLGGGGGEDLAPAGCAG